MSEIRSLDREAHLSDYPRDAMPSLGDVALDLVERLRARLQAEHYDDINLCAEMTERMEAVRQRHALRSRPQHPHYSTRI